MAFTKINAAGIGTTERVTVDGLTVINNLSVGGTVSIAGTLTYEDVTNVDAVGLITARGGVFISAGSSIGIGSAAPTAPIDIHSSNNTLGIVSSTNNGANFDIFDNDTQSRIRTVDGRLHLYADFKNNTPDSAIRFFVDSSNEVARVSPSGVGIGTTNPVSLLTIGKSANPSIRFKDYTNNAQSSITCGGNGQLVFTTDIDNAVGNSDFVFRADSAQVAAEIVRFASDGKVGIGTASPDGNLHVFNTSAGSVTAATDANNLVLESAANVGMSFLTANDALARIKFGDPDATNAGIIVYSHDGDSMRFHTATTERLRISSDGRLLVNTTAARNVGGAVSRLIEVESSGGGAGISIVRNQNTASCSTLDLGKSRGYPHTIVQSGDKLGIVNFCGADGTDLQSSGAQIVGEVDGTPGENDMPGRLIFKTTADGSNSPTERLRITSAGDIGINQSSPHTISGYTGLTINHATHGGFIQFQDNGTNTSRLVGGPNALELNTQTGIPILFKTYGDNERARIASGGQVLTGHDTASTNFHDPQTTTDRTPTIQIHGGNSVASSAALISWNSNTGSYYSNALFLAHSGSSTIGTNGIVSGSNTLGSIVFSGDDGDEFVKGAMISAHVDGTPGASDMPARLQFWTNAGSDTLLERARINTQGHFFVDCTSEPTQGDSGARITNGSYHTFARAHNTAAVLRAFGNNGEFRTIGNGNAQNTNNSYGSLSDIELKENIVDANSQLNDIKALKIRSYNFKESTGYNTHKQIGVVAQELEASGLNGLVETNPDELYIAGDEIPDGKNIGDVKEKGYKTVKYSVLYMKAIKALQEAIAKIETLEAKVSALEG